MNVFIFVVFFAQNLPTLLVGELLCGAYKALLDRYSVIR